MQQTSYPRRVSEVLIIHEHWNPRIKLYSTVVGVLVKGFCGVVWFKWVNDVM